MVAAFHATADALAAQKQFGRALQLRRELVQEWSPGDKKALAALGFVQIGELWRRDGNIVVQDRDLRGDAKALKKFIKAAQQHKAARGEAPLLGGLKIVKR